MKYILTLDFLKKECEEIAGAWDGNEPGKQEDDATTATEILDYISRIEKLLPALNIESV